jgi:hypothetical protein
MKKAISVFLAIMINTCSAYAETFRTPPCAEWDFSATIVEGDPDVSSDEIIKDIVFNATREAGTIDISVSGATPVTRPIRIYSLTPDVGEVRSGRQYHTTTLYRPHWQGPIYPTMEIECCSPLMCRRYEFEVTVEMENVEYLPGTLGEYLFNHMDSLFDNKDPENEAHTKMWINEDYDNGTYEYNTECVAYPVDLTCMAFWGTLDGDSSDIGCKRVVAITPRHVVGGHCSIGVGYVWRFMTRDNQVIDRTLLNSVAIISGWPYYIGELDSDLPSSITPAKLFPQDIHKYIPMINYKHIPHLMIRRGKEIYSNPITRWHNSPSYQDYLNLPFQYAGTSTGVFNDHPFYNEVIGGDSSSPSFVEVNGETVLIQSLQSPGAGLSYAYAYDEICQKLDEMHGGLSPYYPEIVDLSGFPTFDVDYSIPISDGPPSLMSVTIEADGSTWIFIFNKGVNIGSGGSNGFSVTMTETGSIPLVYQSGEGSNTLIYVADGEHIVFGDDTVLDGLDYTQPGDGIEGVSGSDLESFADQEVINNSFIMPI